MEIKVLGVGCPKCTRMYEATLKAVALSGRKAQVKKVYDPAEIAEYGVFAFPAIAIDGEVMSTGKLLAPEEIAHLLARG
jgi:small redox-active disulfide protein 2